MRVMTIAGTRPELIRLCLIMRALEARCEHLFVHTGQNHDPLLRDIFLDELGIKPPDETLDMLAPSTTGATGFGAQMANLMPGIAELLRAHAPDRLVILGDTNSGMAAIVARRMGIPVFHLEAGNRCFDPRVPEEVNRRVIDAASDVWMPYTERSRQHLIAEGAPSPRVFVVGNPIGEVITHHQDRVDASSVLDDLGLTPRGYAIATVHRAESTERPEVLAAIMRGLEQVAAEHTLPVVVSCHPRLADRLSAHGITVGGGVRLEEPFGLFDFVRLEQQASIALTDSGTVQEECALFHVPSVTLRDVTERPETVECGSNFIAGTTAEGIVRAARCAMASQRNWEAPAEYRRTNVAETVANVVLAHHHQLLGRMP
jgi:UDP-N-acetylglucosamine 2-epimerase (non-hydrolysing)